MTTIRRNNILYAVLRAKIVKDGEGYLITERCPFCKRKHTHSIEAGHRVAHCGGVGGTNDRNRIIKTPEGYVSNADGYYIEII